MKHFNLMAVALVTVVLAWSAWEPLDRFTWWLEVAPVFIAAVLLYMTRHRCPLTLVLRSLITVHCVILCVGGHYTYANVPIGDTVKELLGLARNPYDRLGHLFQGIQPAILTREILHRCSPLAGSRWLGFLACSVALAFSAFYEMIEWWAAAATGEAAEDFLGTQGDPWDTQWDMFLAMIGAIAAIVVLGRLHDRQLRDME